MKKTFLFLCKFAVSGILAMLILSVFAFVYYNPPKAEPQPGKYTNSKFVSGAVWTDMSEGVGYGVTNDLGYNDADSYDPGAPVIAVIGSSHTEALQVPQDKTYTAQLQQLLSQNGKDINCLNLGVSGHFLNISVSNFEYFAEEFENVQCAVIETANLSYEPEQLEKMLNGEYHSDLQMRGGLYSLAQKIPYLRLLYKQYQDSRQKNGNAAATEQEPFDYAAYEVGVNKVMEKLSGIATEKDFPLVILYHDSLTVENGKASRKDDAEMVKIFRNCCEKNGILFVDVTERFAEHFEATYELPYGFSNTTMGAGHLNTVGHSVVAEELYDYVAGFVEGN